jgi:hypothetical protein
MNKQNALFLVFSICIFGAFSAQTPSFLITYSCSPTEEFGFAPAGLEVISHGGQFKITEKSESGKTQSFLLLGPILGSVNQFTFFGTEVALTGPLPKAVQEITPPSERGANTAPKELAGVQCSPCGVNDWCAPSLGDAPNGWPGSSMPLEATIAYGNISYRIVVTSIERLTDNDFRRKGNYHNVFAIDNERSVVDAREFVELFQLSPPSDVIRY